MDDATLFTFRNAFIGVVGPAFPTLYHGTNDLQFAVAIAQKSGFHSAQAFRRSYCAKALGGTAVYGPGIYLTSKLDQAQGYGAYILEFNFDKSADYLDVFNPAISKAAVKSVGGGKQTILGAANLDVLMRVTQDYYVLRTPNLVTPSMRT
jgi:hypothetical protein